MLPTVLFLNGLLWTVCLEVIPGRLLVQKALAAMGCMGLPWRFWNALLGHNAFHHNVYMVKYTQESIRCASVALCAC